MFFFSKHTHYTVFKSKPLQVHSHTVRRKKSSEYREKRTSQSASVEGSMTVEASIILPILLCAFVGMLLWGKMFVFQQEAEIALMETARQLGKKEYLYTKKEKEGSSISMAKSLFKRQKKQGDFTRELEVSFYSFLGSSYKKETGELNLCVNYQIRIPALLLGTWKVPLQSKVCQKAWNGYYPTAEERSAMDGYVYITEDGEVYHRDSQCYHLHVTIKEIHQVDAYYNGETSYSACSFCVETDGRKKKLYITEDGDCYHEDASCSGLTRRVQVVSLEEGKKRRPCKECGS